MTPLDPEHERAVQAGWKIVPKPTLRDQVQSIQLPGAVPLDDHPGLVVKPSLLAALDVLAKLGAVILAFFIPVLLGTLVSGNAPGFFGALAALFTVEGAGLFYGLLAAFTPLVQLAFTRYVIDDEGIRVLVQIFSKTERKVQWEKVTMLQHRQTVVDRLFGIERLDVIAYGEKGTTLHLIGLRGATSLRDEVARRMRVHASVGGRLGED